MESTMFGSFICLALFLGFLGSGVEGVSDMKRLTKHLLENYRRVGLDGIPLAEKNDTLTVKFTLIPVQILELDEERQTISLLAWFQMNWKDFLLKWTVEDFGNIEKVDLPPSKIFTPDIMAYFEVPKETHTKEALAIASSDGSVIWIPPVQLTTLCPGLSPGVEEVTCEINMGSWVRSEKLLNIELADEYVDWKVYVPNAKWDLVDSSAKREVKHYPCCEEGYPRINYSFKLKRADGYSTAAHSAGVSLSILLGCLLYLLL